MINPAKRRSVLGWLAAALSALLLAGVMPATAADEHGAHSGHKVIAKAGTTCVRDEDYMRRNHMKILLHQRDLTVHKGIRTTKDSLVDCIECHVNPKTNSVASSKEDFCMGCHSYAAVKPDCFECHSDKPKSAEGAPHPLVPPTEGKDKQSSLSGKMPHKGTPTFYALPGVKDGMRWQMQANLSSSNIGGGVK
ncbi:MAG: hypothetical protein ACYC2E_02905 [Sulfuricella sp.]